VAFDPEQTLTRILPDGETEVIRHLLSAKSPHNAVPLPYFAFDRINGRDASKAIASEAYRPDEDANQNTG